MKKHIIFNCLIIFLVISTTAAKAEPTQKSTLALPKGADYEVLMGKCRICHSLSLITEQRLPLSTWQQEVNKMVGWGAPLDANEAHSLAVYLSKHFPVDRLVNKPPLVDTPINAMPASDVAK